MVREAWLQKHYPFESHFFDTNEGHKIHFLDEGQGKETFLMLHGNPTWSFYYRNLVKEFSKDNRVVVPDHLGCGLSDKPQHYEYTLDNHIKNVEALVKKLNLNKITLVVHDWGGAIGFGLATRNPDLIKQIVILNTAAYTSDYIAPQINICRTPVLGEKVIRTFNAFAWPATFMAVSKPLNREIKKGYLYPYNNYKNRIATARFVQDIPMNKSHRSFKTLEDIEKGLPQLKCPKLILWGKKDFCFNDYFLNRWKEIYPDAQVHEYQEAGHYILEDAKEDVIKEIHNFVENV